MIRIAVWLTVFFLAAHALGPVVLGPYGAPDAEGAPGWWAAVAALPGCTAWAVYPRLAVTASHCVGFIGDVTPVRFRRGVGYLERRGTNVWDGYWHTPTIDVAFLLLDGDAPTTLSVARWLPQPNDQLVTVGMTFGIGWWDAALITVGTYRVGGLGWMLLYRPASDRNNIGPGASGSPVLYGGQVVAVHTRGSDGSPRILAGVPAGTLASALRAYGRNGRMRDHE